MKNRGVILLSAFLAVLVAFSPGLEVFAQTESEFQEEIDEKNKELQKLNVQINQTQTEVTNLQGQSRTLQNALKELDYKIDQVNFGIQSSEVNIDKLGLELQSLGDLFGDMDNITSKRMFGGYGVYKDGHIFAIITSDGELYFKVDEELKKKFKKHGSKPFVYTGHKNRGPVEMPYWTLPEEIMEDREELTEWVETSTEVSRSSK